MRAAGGASGLCAVLFDLDGTLFDHEGAARRALGAWLPTLGVEADEPLVRRWFEAEERHVADWRAGRIGWAEQRRRRLREVLPEGAAPPIDEDADSVFLGYLRAYRGAWRPFDDVAATIAALAARGLRLGVLTNGETAQQREKVHAIGLCGALEFVLTAQELGAAKPDPCTYLAACDRFGLAPAQVLHVGDLPGLDVIAPRAAGLPALLIDREDRHRHEGSMRTLHELGGRIDGMADGSAE